MRKWVTVLVLCGLASCGLFESKERKTQKLVQKELDEMDWNSVDAYPIFEECDENWTQTKQRECFENGLLEHFSETLSGFDFILDEQIDPTVQVDFLVDEKGKVTVTRIEKDTAIDRLMPEFDEIIRQSLVRIPPLAPAIKNRIPVRAKFRIPIVLNVNP